MSYPEPRYTGDSGLVNATLRPADHEPDVRYPSGGRAHYLATGEDYFETLAQVAAGKVVLTDHEKAALYQRHDNTWV